MIRSDVRVIPILASCKHEAEKGEPRSSRNRRRELLPSRCFSVAESRGKRKRGKKRGGGERNEEKRTAIKRNQTSFLLFNDTQA
ncbi:hypothetical protein WN48_11035 [Eufriesea mexicana]|nr:hypothetical protein WN48_11035 [Eufriesea mexicana]